MEPIKINEQPWWEAAIETALNIGSGFLVSWAMLLWVVAPLWHIPFNMSDSLSLTALFTFTSVVRSYAWRRLANWRSKRNVRNG